MPLQWHNQIWQSLEEAAGKRCSECGVDPVWWVGRGLKVIEDPCVVDVVRLVRDN